jgi:hypothetical protein
VIHQATAGRSRYAVAVETTEKIVEAYVRYRKGWFTLPNIKCTGQFEIDLLAIDPLGRSPGRYHIESGVSISGAFSKLTAKTFSADKLKMRVEGPSQRRTLGFFAERKFNPAPVVEKLAELGFKPGNYGKIVVSWGWDRDVPSQAKAAGIELWDFRQILRDIAERSESKTNYFTDDTMRTLQLMAKARKVVT